MNNFRLITILCVAGIGGIVFTKANSALLAQSDYQTSQQSIARLQFDSALEQQRAQITRANADVMQRNQVTSSDSLILYGYTLSDVPPDFAWVDRAADPSRRVMLYDQNRACVGQIHQHQFRFIKTDSTACKLEP